jgi:hypothetical protein
MKKIINKELRTTAMFKAIVTLKNGGHKIIVGLSVHLVATIVGCFKSCKDSIWNERLAMKVNDETVVVSDFASVRFLNERTGEELLSIA